VSVYVDGLFATPPHASWKWSSACHLTADSVEELHAFAKSIGLKKAWFQPHGRHPHYDLNERRRGVALSAGAIEINIRKRALPDAGKAE
jgi:hypothetical protein